MLNIGLLDQLKRAGGEFVPIADLGLDLERTIADLDALAEFGFRIERHPYRGAAYRGPAERLCPDQIEWGWAPRLIGRRLAVWNRVTSTNDLAARAASSLANDGLAILAEEQTAGRGSRGRVWTSPPRSSILLSVLIFPPPPLDDPAWLTALAAVAVANVVTEFSGGPARIKWPNDVRVEGRKVAGILVERARGTVIGVGLNVNWSLTDVPESIQSTATALSVLAGQPIDRSEVARRLVEELGELYARSTIEGPHWLSGEYRHRSEHMGQAVEVDTVAGPVVRGHLVGVDLRDGLTLTGPNSQTLWVPLADVGAIRPDLKG